MTDSKTAIKIYRDLTNGVRLENIENDLQLHENLTCALRRLQALGDLLSTLGPEESADETIGVVGSEIYYAARGTQRMVDAWHDTKKKQMPKLVPGGAS